MRNFFDFITPSSGKFDCALASFDSSVHKEGFLIAKNVVKFLFNQSELAVVNRSWGEGHFLSLINEGFQDSRMTVALIDGWVSRQKVKIAFTWVKKRNYLNSPTWRLLVLYRRPQEEGRSYGIRSWFKGQWNALKRRRIGWWFCAWSRRKAKIIQGNKN